MEEQTFARALRESRLAAGLSQEQLAERADMSVQAVSALERGIRTRPYPSTCDRLAKALGLGGERKRRLLLSARQDARTPSEVPRHNLPSQITAFVGRSTELGDLLALLASTRLVTIAGPGGLGKTRIALHVASGAIDAYPDGIWLVELAAVVDEQLVAATVAAALPGEVGRAAPLDDIVKRLRNREALIILDNCEHVIAAAAATTERILRYCPNVRIVATSREPLAIAGEQLYRLYALPLPPASTAISADAALEYASVRLFVDRARACRHSFELDDENADGRRDRASPRRHCACDRVGSGFS